VDSKDTGRFLEFLDEQAVFRFANAPPAAGTAAIAAMVGGFFDSLQSLSHEVRGAWSVPGRVFVEGVVTYVRRDGRRVEIAFANVLAISGARVSDYAIYIDPSPLFAP
jgi:ketosteroid isomerase-like protein